MKSKNIDLVLLVVLVVRLRFPDVYVQSKVQNATRCHIVMTFLQSSGSPCWLYWGVEAFFGHAVLVLVLTCLATNTTAFIHTWY